MGLRVTCKHCGGAHPAYECRKQVRIGTASSPDRLQTPKSDVSASPPRKEVHTQSTAVRKDVLGQQETASLALNHSKRSKAVTTAGTQALPVDTNSSRAMSSVASTSAGTVGNKDRQPIPKRGRGRPKTITDMKVYKAMKQREYRARKK